MPRIARIVVPGIAHHVRQRGNRRQQTFFCEADYCRYIELGGEGCRNSGVDVLAWCLMPNHVHLVRVPPSPDSLASGLALAHRSYTRVVNRRNGWQGHLWQNRFFSCPMDEEHTMKVVRYVELNPVRSRLVEVPQSWRWSSARARIMGMPDPLVENGLWGARLFLRGSRLRRGVRSGSIRSGVHGAKTGTSRIPVCQPCRSWIDEVKR